LGVKISTSKSATVLHGSTTLPFVIPTRISYIALLETTTYATLRKERRRNLINATPLNRKSGGAKPRDLQFS
jgi:hypothetical protein